MNPHLRDDPRYKDHERRPDLAGEHPLGDTCQLIALMIFLIAGLLDYFLIGFPQKLNNLVSISWRLPISLVLLTIGGWLALHGIRVVFGDYHEDPIMITVDLFARMRHPIYLGAILIYIAVLVLSLSVMASIAWIGVLAMYQWLAKDEERRMLKVFGEDYRTYQQRVPMWLPFQLRKRKEAGLDGKK